MIQLNLFPSIQERFETHLIEDSSVYDSFKNKALVTAKAKSRRISAKFLIECIRHEKKIKIDNTFTSRYVRKFCNEYPQYEHLFELRNLNQD